MSLYISCIDFFWFVLKIEFVSLFILGFGIKISFIGDLTKFPKNIQDSCEKVKEMTKEGLVDFDSEQ